MTSELLSEFKFSLQGKFSGDIKTDSITKTLYSTDASIYKIQPLGVVFPRNDEDLNSIVESASKFKIPILPRGSGSSLAGQTVGAAIVIDCSKYLNKIVNINPEARSAVVQPGVVLDDLNKAAKQFGLKFGPDPASSDRATFGGMTGNNSTGAHSIQYGMTADNLISIKSILADGTDYRFGITNINEIEKGASSSTILGNINRSILSIRANHAEHIKQKWPLTWRKSSGYGINYLLPWVASEPPMWDRGSYLKRANNQINLASFIAGSEGTLAVFKELEVALVKTPVETVLAVLSYDSIESACDATPPLLDYGPTAVELIPRELIQRAKSVPAYAKLLWFVKDDPAALLIVEFSGEDKAQLVKQARKLSKNVVVAIQADEQADIWKVRKVGLGLLMSIPGDIKPLPFVEDVAVPVEKLGTFVRGFQRIMNEYGTHGNFYAHASAGCLHVRPLLNIKKKSAQKAMRNITRDIVALTVELGGSLSGEHGDGLARSEWLLQIFGADLINAFADIKHAADPDNILNPGKKIDPVPMEQNLRYSTGYRTKTWTPVMKFGAEGGIVGAIEMCNGAGVCRKVDGIMCPSYQATRDEMHSTRGRANLLRNLISTPNNYGEAQSAVFNALDLCLGCKGCKAECPSAVDMGKLKYEFLNHYYSTNRRPLRDYLFAYIDSLLRLGKYIAPVINGMQNSNIGRKVVEKTIGISSKRPLPKLRHLKNNIPSTQTVKSDNSVIFISDAFSEYYYPENISAAFNVLQRMGFKVIKIDSIGCSRTFISMGFLEEAKRHTIKVRDEIKQIDPDGMMPILGIEPSEIYTLRDEYIDFLPKDQFINNMASRSFMIDEFIVRNDLKKFLPRSDDGSALKKNSTGKVLIHGHCYQNAQSPLPDGLATGTDATVEMLDAIGYATQVTPGTCCGMAGSFGYEAEHYDLSMRIGEMRLFPAVRSVDRETIIAASGVSCRTQIENGVNKETIHPIRLVEQVLLNKIG